jgi:hypothetical protein
LLTERNGGEEMNKKVLGIIIALMAVTTLSTTISVVFATKSTPVAGVWTITPVPDSVVKKPVGIALIQTSVDDIELVGNIAGSGTYDRRLVIHNYGPNSKDGPLFKVTQQGLITIYATFDGKSGTLYIKTVANSQKLIDGEWTIIGGTEGLVSLHGQGTFDHLSPTKFTYEGQVHFSP